MKKKNVQLILAEMRASSKQICRLCLEIAPTCDCKPIEDIKKDILEVLLINVDFEISDYVVACTSCLGKLHDCFEFKSLCINSLTNVDIKLGIKKEALQSKLSNHEGTCQNNSQVCRLCMSLIGDDTLNYSAAWKDGVILKDMIRSCFPDMDLNTVQEQVMCKPCLSNMQRYSEFRKSCLEMEQRIEHFRQMAGTADRIRLEDVLKFKDCNVLGKPLFIKKECSDVDIVDESIMKCLKNEAESIKCEEIHIKDELDDGIETTDPVQSGVNDSLERDGFSKAEEKVEEIPKKGKTYFCPKCPYSSEYSDYIRKHMRRHLNNKSHKCFLCPFITDSTFSLKAHMTSHRGATKAYGCTECPYETNYRSSHRNHLLMHKDESEVEMQKCLLCPYRNKHKRNLMKHQLVHLNSKEIPMYKCAKCEFETKRKYYLVLHLKMHQDPESVRKFKCDKCPYRAKWPAGIRKHMTVHSDKRPFSCDQCTYSGKYKGQLHAHKRVHQTDAERKMYKCKVCSYQAKYSDSLKDHMAKSHMDHTVPVMKCANCSYETVVKSYLSKHMRKWHSYANRMHMGLGETVDSQVQAEMHVGKKESLKMKRRKVNKS